MRKVIGWIYYLAGGGIAIFAAQLVIKCEAVGLFGLEENYTFDLWEFLCHTSGHHRAYPQGYLIHWIRDISLFLIGILLIHWGREQYVEKRKMLLEKTPMIVCPGCKRKTYAEAYCRFCGFNLVTHQPSQEMPVFMPVWKLSLLAYTALSLFLLLLNLVIIKLGWG